MKTIKAVYKMQGDMLIYYADGSWRLNDLNGENIRIFYWQYLPEKPKEG